MDRLGAVPALSRLVRPLSAPDLLVRGMVGRGFTTYLDPALQAPVIVTFRIPEGGWFQFQPFYDFLHARGVQASISPRT